MNFLVSKRHRTLKLSLALIELLVSSVQTGTTALFFAAQGGFLDIAQILLERGAPVDSSSVVGADMLTVANVSTAALNWQTRQPEWSLPATHKHTQYFLFTTIFLYPY